MIFGQKSPFILETVRDRPMVTMDHFIGSHRQLAADQSVSVPVTLKEGHKAKKFLEDIHNYIQTLKSGAVWYGNTSRA